MTVPGPVPAVPSAPDREAGLTRRVEAAIFEVVLGNRDEQPVAAEVIALVREQVAREIEASCAAFPLGNPCPVCSHFAAVAREVPS